MKTIHKYEIQAGLNSFELPHSAEILSVQVQGDKPQLWAMVDTDNPIEARHFFTFGTGWDMDKELAKENKFLKIHKYIGTFQLSGWGFVFHLFEVK